MPQVRKIDEGQIDSFRYVAFEVPRSEIEKRMKDACRTAAGILEEALEDHGVSITGKVKQDLQKVALCKEDPHDVILRYVGTVDRYIPDPEEIAAEKVLSEALSSIPNAPRDAQAADEPGYELPEYSLYWGPDARSWTGRWYYSGGGNEDICWFLIPDEKTCERVNNRLSTLEEKVRSRKNELLFAVWKP